MEIIVYALPEALVTWREQGLIKGFSPFLKNRLKSLIELKGLIEIRLNPEEVGQIEKIDNGFIYHRLGWRRLGSDKGDSL